MIAPLYEPILAIASNCNDELSRCSRFYFLVAQALNFTQVISAIGNLELWLGFRLEEGYKAPARAILTCHIFTIVAPAVELISRIWHRCHLFAKFTPRRSHNKGLVTCAQCSPSKRSIGLSNVLYHLASPLLPDDDIIQSNPVGPFSLIVPSKL